MHWIKSVVYGIVCGLSEFLPISLSGHQSLFSILFGSQIKNPVSDLLVHLSLLAVVIFANYALISRLRRDIRTSSRKVHNYAARRSRYDMQLIKNATIPLVVFLLLRLFIDKFSGNLLILTLCFAVNGVILYLPSRFMRGNKDARNMSAADALLIGLLGGLSVFPGISRIGASASAASARGADHDEALNWCLLLSIPALITQIIMDLIAISSGIPEPYEFGHYLLIIVGTLTGGYLTISILRSIISKSGFSGFAFYSWGAAMLTLVLYMIV